MSIFRRPSDEPHERTPEEREYARRLREARRQGLPDPPRPASLGGEPAATWGEPEPEAQAEPDPPQAVPFEDPAEPVPDPEPEPEAHASDPLAPDPGVWRSDPDADPEPDAEPRARDADPDDDIAWTEPEPEPEPEVAPAPEPNAGREREPEPEAIDEAPPVWEEPPPRVQPTASEPAPPGDDVPGRRLGVRRQPPPLPARSATRRPPTPPRRRYTAAPARRSPAGPPTHRKRRWLGRIAAVVALVGMIGVLWFLLNLFQPGKGDGDGRVAVVVPQGATARQIGDLLAEKGVVSSGFFFDLRARISGDRDNLKAGRFVLAEDMSYAAALDRLVQSPEAPPTITVTIPEGLSRKEVAPLVKQAGVKGSYRKASRRHRGLDPQDYGAPRGASLEGFLFPATYELPKRRPTAKRLVDEQLEAWRVNWRDVNVRKARRKNLTPYDVLIIASMIEREAQVDKERRLVAAVIYNRLREGMALGIDATTRYELDEWSRPLRVSELQADTPYNTRTNTGLPPTPIGNPGRASMIAAANPANVDYLYYVVKPGTCGEHAFSSTDAQFQRDVAAYEAARAANGGQSPDTCDD